jgi:hypothetical protein
MVVCGFMFFSYLVLTNPTQSPLPLSFSRKARRFILVVMLLRSTRDIQLL